MCWPQKKSHEWITAQRQTSYSASGTGWLIWHSRLPEGLQHKYSRIAESVVVPFAQGPKKKTTQGLENIEYI